MKADFSKAVFLTFLMATIVMMPAASAEDENSGPDIEAVEPWPSDVGGGDHLYTDARIDISDESVDDVWFEVKKDGEREGRGTLTDSNEDGYYVSPAGVEVDGGESYEIEVKACDTEDECASKETTVRVSSSCELNLAGNCIRW